MQAPPIYDNFAHGFQPTVPSALSFDASAGSFNASAFANVPEAYWLGAVGASQTGVLDMATTAAAHRSSSSIIGKPKGEHGIATASGKGKGKGGKPTAAKDLYTYGTGKGPAGRCE